MAFNFNGNTPKKILYNGLNVAKLVYNGVVVWMSKVLATISGILPITLTDCTGDDLVDYKIYGNSEYEGLPDGYTRVEYIESTGTQYIDTRYYPNNLTDVECKFMYNQLTGNTVSSVFGVRDTDMTVKQFLMSVYNFSNGLNNTRIDNVSPVVNTEYILRITPRKAYWNGTEILNMNNSIANCPDYSMFMFGRNTRSGVASQFYGKIYYLKIYEAGVLVRNFIPCTNPSNVAGMYDTVNGVFYTNAGTGTFNVGSVVSKKSVGDLVTDTSDINYGKYKIPVLTNSHTTNIYLNKPLRKTSKLPIGYTELEHIRSTGTQYIDTGIKANNNIKILGTFAIVNTSADRNYICGCFSNNNSRTQFSYSTNAFYGWGANYNNTAHLSVDTNIHTFEMSYTNFKLDNNIIYIPNSNNFSDNVNIYLFALNGNGEILSKSDIKILNLKIYNNNVLVRNFIPCKNPSNVIGLYDTVNDVFYTNAGSGSFIAGAEVETVYYTDYLDYENQKVVRNVDDNDKGIDTPVEESIVLPAVSTDEGTVTVDVDTEIAPSYAEIKYYKNGS